VNVGGTQWFETDFLTYAQTNQFEFEYIDTPPSLVFGDGSAGNIPPASASIVVTYIATSGQAGTISASTGNNTIITGPVTPLVVNFQTIPLTITNPSSGPGFNAESAAHIKATAPFAFKSRSVAVTGEDYYAQSNAYADPVFGTVAAAEAISARSAAQDLAFQGEIYQLSADVQSQQSAIQLLGSTTSNSGTSTVIVGAPFSVGGILQTTISGLVGGIFESASVGSLLTLSGLNNAGNNGTFLIVSAGAPLPVTAVTIQNPLAVAEGPTSNVSWFEIYGPLGDLVARTSDISNTQLPAGNSALSTINAKLTSLLASLNSALITLAGSGSSAGDIAILNQQINALGFISTTMASSSVGQINTVVTTIGSGGTINPTQYMNLLSYINAANAALTVISNQVSAISTGLAPVKSDLATVIQPALATAVGTTIPAIQGSTGVIAGTTPNLSSVFTAIGNDSTAITNDATAISTTLNALTASTNTGTIGNPGYIACYGQILNTQFGNGFGDIYALQQHLDTIESADCAANVVSVPILALDSSGFYTAPSVALIQSLQNYLNSIKEVTQTPIVTNGSSALILSGVNLVYGYTGTTQSLAQNAVQAALDGLYKSRSFGQSLYVSDIDTTIRAVPNIVYCNIVQILAINALTSVPVPLDPNGNLVISINQVITEDPSLNIFTPILINPTSTTSV
jgi:hypothetical protein